MMAASRFIAFGPILILWLTYNVVVVIKLPAMKEKRNGTKRACGMCAMSL